MFGILQLRLIYLNSCLWSDRSDRQTLASTPGMWPWTESSFFLLWNYCSAALCHVWFPWLVMDIFSCFSRVGCVYLLL